jgi:hypothetical protein
MLARVGVIDRSVGRSACALRSDRPKRATVALRASVSSDRRAQALVPIRPVRALGRESTNQQFPASHGSHLEGYDTLHSARPSGTEESPACPSAVANDVTPPGRILGGGGSSGNNGALSPSASSAGGGLKDWTLQRFRAWTSLSSTSTTTYVTTRPSGTLFRRLGSWKPQGSWFPILPPPSGTIR